MGLFNKLLRLDRNDTVIAAGGDTLTLCVGPQGEPWSLPAYIAFDESNRRVLAVGEEALAMRGKEPGGVKVCRFFENGGFISDTDLAEAAIRYALKVKSTGGLITPRVLFVGPEHQKSVARDICVHAGAREIITVRPAMAAAIGARLKEDELKSVLLLERDWCAFAVLEHGNYVAEFEGALGVEALLEEVALHALVNRNVILDSEALYQVFLRVGLSGGEIPGWEADQDKLKTGPRRTALYTEADFIQAASPYGARLRWRCQRALAAADQAKLRGGPNGPLYLFSPYARLPGVRQLLGRAFDREVIAPEAGEFAMARGGRMFLHEIMPTIIGTSVVVPNAR